MSFLKFGCLALVLFLSGHFYAQEDTTNRIRHKELPMIIINRHEAAIKVRIPPQDYWLGRKDITTLGTDDVGELLSKLPGSTIKSYGGLGGLKSASIRGLGGQHTSVVIDMFEVSNSQSGQVNFGQVQTEGLESLTIRHTPDIYSMTPVSTQFSGAQLFASTFMRSYSESDSKLKFVGRYGSFGRKEIYADGELKRKDWHFAGFGKVRDAVGEYPFRYPNGNTEIAGVRKNNDYRDYYYGAKAGRMFENGHQLNLMYRGSNSTQGLPGAVILYNETADERLGTSDHRLMGEYLFHRENRFGRVHASGAYNRLTYDDPSYLNAEGKLHELYDNLGISVGFLESVGLDDFRLKYGVEQKIDVLQSNRAELGRPVRAGTYVMGGMNYRKKRLECEAFLGGQFIYDQNAESKVKTTFQFTPVVNVDWIAKAGKLYFTAWYKRTFRMPSFNELYFGSVGNLNLKPEVAHQTSFDTRFFPISIYKETVLEFFGSVFFSEVTNKIVAIPTKNLFVWSLQNVEHARIYGTSVSGRFSQKFKTNYTFELQGSYTWQSVKDVGKESLTNGHQIAYSPEQVGNIDLVFSWKELNFRVSNNAVSSRYALNQNVPQNFLNGYWITDATLGYQFKFPNKHVLAAQLNVKNLWNTPYAFIRSFVMPGRHFLITLNYEIH